MAEVLKAPILVKPLPAQIVSVGSNLPPLFLSEYIQSPDEFSGAVYFKATNKNGDPLPEGLICTADGTMTGTPANHTEGHHEILITAENNSGIAFTTSLSLTIKERIAIMNSEEVNQLKSKVWEALKDNLPLPEIENILNREISAAELYYLLQRFAVLTIWDVYNLDAPGPKKLLKLDGMSPHYNIYDRGSCLVGAPKDLFTYDRTLADALQTAQVMAREVYKRNWTIELSGFNKMIRASWVELQHLADQHGKQVDILHFNPSNDDIRIYTEQSRARIANEMGL